MIASINTQTRASDRPIEDAAHDDFQRNPFALRIARTLIDRSSPESIVVGLYGKWGEGKTSVLQLLRQSLAQASDKVAVMDFNPWRFPDETQLLTNFFNKLAKTIDKNLDTAAEKAAKSIGKYTKYITPLLPAIKFGLPLIGGIELDPEKVGKSIEAAAEAAAPDLEELKERIEQLISESGRRIIIIIDDIDRLEKKQIQAIFRLVKLTADFQQTAYLLAFDDVMVARAIGEMFESGDEGELKSRAEQAGQNFLEKIVQVPLRLPRARPDDLLLFCWNRLEEALKETNTILPEDEQERLGDGLRSGVLPRLTTPRLAVRYANAVQFNLPLLRGEVNVVDQLLVEALHIFYPQLHHYVAIHEAVFAGSVVDNRLYILAGEGKNHQEKHQRLIDAALTLYQGDERVGALALLGAIFPRISELYQGDFPRFINRRPNLSADELTRRQAVAAPTHFARYFAYAVVRGDVSDKEFGDFLAQPVATQLPTARDLLMRLGPSVFLLKIQARYPTLTSEQATNLWMVLAELSPEFDSSRISLFGMIPTQLTTAAKLMMGLLEKVETEDERYQLVTNLVSSGGSFALVEKMATLLRLNQRKQVGNNNLEEIETDPNFNFKVGPQDLFSLERWQQLIASLPEMMLTRALKDAGEIPLYKSHPADARELLSIWAARDGQPKISAYIRKLLADNPEDIHELFAAYSSRIASGNREYLANLNSAGVSELNQLIGPELFKIAQDLLNGEVVTSYPGRDPDEPTPQERLRQFVFLYERLPDNPIN